MKNKGFTLIELLVVIAIIGILSSVVLASLTTARSRGQAASVQSQLSNMRAQAELYYSTNGNSYGTAGTSCANSAALFAGATNGLTQLINGADSITDLSCDNTTTGWAVKTTAATGGSFFCVDSTGVSTSSATDSFTITDQDCD